MKPIDDAFSGTWIRPVILSGILLTAGIHPLARTLVSPALAIYDLPAAALLLIEVIFFGLLVSSAGTWIYYVYEGFVLAPLTRVARGRNKRRLARMRASETTLLEKSERSNSEQDQLDVLQDRIRTTHWSNERGSRFQKSPDQPCSVT